MEKETKALIDFYDNRIKDLEDKNKEKQDKLNQALDDCDLLQHKLDKIIEYIDVKDDSCYSDELNTCCNYILQIIKGEDK